MAARLRSLRNEEISAGFPCQQGALDILYLANESASRSLDQIGEFRGIAEGQKKGFVAKFSD
jgi:hypothetical protein